jgi:hypothetical protein
MSATMARQGGQVQLEQSDMHLVLNVAKMAKGGCSRAAIEHTQYVIKKPRAEVREEKKRGVEFLGHKKVKAAMERHPAMIRQNQSDCCLPCQNGTAKHPQTRWKRKGTGAPPPVRHRYRTPNLTPSLPGTPSPPGKPSLPGTPPAPPGSTQGTQISQTDNLPAANAVSRVSLSKTQGVNLDAIAEDSLNDDDFDPQLLTDERASCG